VADADLWAFGDAADWSAVGAAAGTPTEPPDESPPADSAFGDWSAADDPFGGASAGAGDTVVFVGSVAVPVVVVVASVVVPASCASESAGIAQLNARTSIPLARALAPFIPRIVRVIDS
jgi:hypothetical protein